MRWPLPFLGLALTALLWPFPAVADDSPKPRIAGLTTSFEGSRVLVDFALRHAFDERLRERIEAGLTTTITYELQITRDRRWWLDRTVDSSRLEVTAKYDALTMEFRVNFLFDGKLMDSRIFQELEGVERAMTRIVELPAFSLEDNRSGREVTLRVRADLGSRTWFSLVPTRITTDWAESRRFIPARVGG